MPSGKGIHASARMLESLLRALSGSEMFSNENGAPGTHPKNVGWAVSFFVLVEPAAAAI